MQLLPSFDRFCSLAEDATLVPVWREFLFDVDTAVTAYAKLAEPPFGFLLESVVGGEKWARYSFLGTRPSSAWRLQGGAVSTWTPEQGWQEEPSAGLDPVSTAAIDNLINGLRDKMGITSVVVTHELESVERIADRVLFLHQGQILAHGTLQEVRAMDNPILQQFLSGSTEGPLTLGQSRAAFYSDLLNI